MAALGAIPHSFPGVADGIEQYKDRGRTREQFQLELEPSKTRLLQFGRFARQNAERMGQQPEGFVFLGFNHSCGQTRTGSFKVQRRTSIKKYRAKLKELKAWVRKRRSEVGAGQLLREAKRRLQGHLNYYAITDNSRMCESFRSQFTPAVPMA